VSVQDAVCCLQGAYAPDDLCLRGIESAEELVGGVVLGRHCSRRDTRMGKRGVRCQQQLCHWISLHRLSLHVLPLSCAFLLCVVGQLPWVAGTAGQG
jgi:hypothetical protein